jgi:hypothetical protein
MARTKEEAMLGIYSRTFMIATRTDAGQSLDTAPGSLVRLIGRLLGLAGVQPVKTAAR